MRVDDAAVKAEQDLISKQSATIQKLEKRIKELETKSKVSKKDEQMAALEALFEEKEPTWQDIANQKRLPEKDKLVKLLQAPRTMANGLLKKNGCDELTEDEWNLAKEALL